MNSPKTKYTLVKMTNGTNKLVLKTKKTLSQDLYNAVFHPKTSSNIRDIIFKFKCEERFEIVDKTIRCFDAIFPHNNGEVNFKYYSSSLSGSQYPIKNRKELYVIYRDWINCHRYFKTGPFIRREAFGNVHEYLNFLGTLPRHLTPGFVGHIMNRTLDKLMDIRDFHIGINEDELWKILLTNDKFDKKLILKTPRAF